MTAEQVGIKDRPQHSANVALAAIRPGRIPRYNASAHQFCFGRAIWIGVIVVGVFRQISMSRWIREVIVDKDAAELHAEVLGCMNVGREASNYVIAVLNPAGAGATRNLNL